MSTLLRIKALFDDDFDFLCVHACARVRVRARWITSVRFMERPHATDQESYVYAYAY